MQPGRASPRPLSYDVTYAFRTRRALLTRASLRPLGGDVTGRPRPVRARRTSEILSRRFPEAARRNPGYAITSTRRSAIVRHSSSVTHAEAPEGVAASAEASVLYTIVVDLNVFMDGQKPRRTSPNAEIYMS
ncbi:hypothetical protein EVAR_77098_1 [Eumeta japonica]|uniref:Uncharacterized protein n=1 Tax=Eumeta variegata TaxID=151549 RepID=A0A4C1T1P6_EUMVA|nr:hypothetical protein EVAR_77098_1 [Eumeta japonica]